MINIKQFEPIFMASPFTKFGRGHAGAYLDICKIASRFYLRYAVSVFSPISNCYGMCHHGDLPITGNQFWHEFNYPFVKACGALVIAKMDGWDESFGVADERNSFRAAEKPIYYMDVETLELTQ